MGTDIHVAKERGQLKGKAGTKHRYAAIEHRVIDSDAYIDLTFSARALLLQVARQLTLPNNNGRLLIAHSYLKQYGFSANTLTRATAELMEHGFLFRTRAGGYHQGVAFYAVTWLGLCENTDGLEGLKQGVFKVGAWRDWAPDKNKSRPPKVRAINLKNGEWTQPTTSKMGTGSLPKNEASELMPVHSPGKGAIADDETTTTNPNETTDMTTNNTPATDNAFTTRTGMKYRPMTAKVYSYRPKKRHVPVMKLAA